MKKKMNNPKPQKKVKPGRKKRIIYITMGIIVLLIVVRLILPYIILRYANKTLATMPGYYGHVEDIDLAIYRGAYQINNIYLNKIDSASGEQSPFFNAPTIDLSIEWGALFHGSVVGELVFLTPHMNFIKEKVELNQMKKDSDDFRILLKKFMPIKINRFEIQNGVLEYLDSTSTPVVDLKLTNAHIVATNLRNSYDSSALLPSAVNARANVYDGILTMNMKLNPLAENPTFDLNASLDSSDLTKFNDFFKAYGKFDVHRGKFGLYTEIAAKDGKFTGYVKPIIRDLDVVGPEDRKDGFLQKLWEEIVGGAGIILKNQSKDQIATKVPLKGDLSNPTYGIGTAIFEVLKNAFIHALFPSIDYQINIASVGGKSSGNESELEKMYNKNNDTQKKSSDKKKKEK